MYKLIEKSDCIVRLSDKACIPADPANTDYQEYLAWVAEGNVPKPVDPPTPEQIQAEYISQVQRVLDGKAQELGYDNIISICTYAGSSNEKFAAEGKAVLKWRDDVWTKCFEVLQDVQAAKRPVPAIDELMKELPEMKLDEKYSAMPVTEVVIDP